MRRITLLALSLASLPATAAPITFNTALPVTCGEAILRARFIRHELSAPDREVTVSTLALAGGFGLSGDLALFAALPLLDKRLTAAESAIRRRARGAGDLSLFLRYTALQRDAPGRTLRIAPFAGLIAPTGRDDARDELGRLPRPLQTGSGAWGALAGFVLTRQTLRWQFDGQLGATAYGRDEGYAPGNAFALDLSGQYRIWPRRLSGGVPGFVYAVLESRLEDLRADRIGGAATGSGGSQWFLAPGLQYVSRRWVVEGAVQWPLVQNLPAGALQDDVIARLSLRTNF